MDRRTFFFASSGAAIGSLVVSEAAQAEKAEPSLFAGSGLISGVPKPLKHKAITGFLSEAQIAPHHSAHYGGALKSFVAIEKEFEQHFLKSQAIQAAAFETMQRAKSSKGNSVILHELYFDGLTEKASRPSQEFLNLLQKRFGSFEKWLADFLASAKVAAGWAMLVVHPINGKLYNVVSDEHAQGPLWLAAPLVVLDVYEHAFYIDYHNRKAEYVEKFAKFIDWNEVGRRYRQATK